MFDECNGKESFNKPALSKWLIRFEFDREEMNNRKRLEAILKSDDYYKYKLT